MPEPLGPRAKGMVRGLRDVLYCTDSFVRTYMGLATFCSTEYCVVSLSCHNINTNFCTFLLWFSFFLIFRHFFILCIAFLLLANLFI